MGDYREGPLAPTASHHPLGAKADAPSLENRRLVRIVGDQQLHSWRPSRALKVRVANDAMQRGAAQGLQDCRGGSTCQAGAAPRNEPGLIKALMCPPFESREAGAASLCATPGVSCTENPSAYGDPSVQLITLTGGGNDEQFQWVLQGCTDVPPFNANSEQDCTNAIQAAENGQTPEGGGRSQGINRAFVNKLAALYDEIHGLAPNARILVLGYPRLFADSNEDNNSCKVANYDYMDQQKQQQLDVAEEYLNEDIAKAVHQTGYAEYVPLWIPSSAESLPGVTLLPGAEYAGLHGLHSTLPDENLPSFYDATLQDPTTAADYAADGGVDDHAACQGGGGSNDWINGASIAPQEESYHPSALGYDAFAAAITSYMGRNPTSPLGNGDPVIGQGQTITKSVVVPSGSATLSVSVSWANGGVSTDLTSPSGKVIGSGTTDPTVSYQAGATWESFVITDPQTGTWTVSSTGTSVPPGGADVNVTAEAVPATELPPTAVASATPTSGVAPLTVSFSAQGSSAAQGSIASYRWDFGDGTTGSGERVTHTYTSAGVYEPTVTVTDTDGDVADVSIVSDGCSGTTLAPGARAWSASPWCPRRQGRGRP